MEYIPDIPDNDCNRDSNIFLFPCLSLCRKKCKSLHGLKNLRIFHPRPLRSVLLCCSLGISLLRCQDARRNPRKSYYSYSLFSSFPLFILFLISFRILINRDSIFNHINITMPFLFHVNLPLQRSKPSISPCTL